jgi:hypothetical protein
MSAHERRQWLRLCACTAAINLLFINLHESEALFSPTTRYRDLALGPSRFHWQSQSTGRRPAGPGVSPSRSGVWGLPAMRATRVNGRWPPAVAMVAGKVWILLSLGRSVRNIIELLADTL